MGRASRVHSRGGDGSEVESVDLRHGPVVDMRPLVGSLGQEKPRASVDGQLGETGGLVDGVVGDVDPLPRLRTFMVDRWGRRPSGRGTVSPTTEITATSQRHGQCGAG